ncbi:MAG: hypothetical protein K9N55_09330 [Phycisphaerae bacterium]|nr:hypothetical protein [Phycisphaerae bacterium]
MHPVVIFILFVGLFIVGAIFSAINKRKRREAMIALATRLGLRFNPDRDRHLANEYKFLDKLRSGSNRYAFNVLSGTYQGHPVAVFDFHYETHSSDSEGNSETHHHYFSFFILHLPVSCPELTIGPEGFLSKIAQAVGYDDIDFESHEFSRQFCVRSRDKKFAYDVCHARMIEYLLANKDLVVEIEDRAMALYFSRCLKPELIEPNLDHLIQLRNLLPDYLMEGNA